MSTDSVPSRSFRSRLGAKLDVIRQKLMDNNISLLGSAVDFIRFEVKMDKFLDIQSRVVTEYDVIQAVFPPFQGIPIRNIGSYFVSTVPDKSLIPVGENLDLISTVLIPLKYTVYPNDLLIRVFTLSTYQKDRLKDIGRQDLVNDQFILILQVKEALSVFGEKYVTYLKYNCTIFDEHIEPVLLDKIVEIGRRRELW